jgi:hypothetical protein
VAKVRIFYIFGKDETIKKAHTYLYEAPTESTSGFYMYKRVDTVTLIADNAGVLRVKVYSIINTKMVAQTLPNT